MVRSSCCEKVGMKKGPWSPEEDEKLVSYIHRHGHTNWRALPKAAGLVRCGKSCRLRWSNYLRPDIKRGNFTPQEDRAIINYHSLLGNRWSAIAAKLPGRTDNEIKNVWNTRLKKTLVLASSSTPNNRIPAVAIKLQHSFVSSSGEEESSSNIAAPNSIAGDAPRPDDQSALQWDDDDDIDDEVEEMIEDSFWAETLFMTAADLENSPSMDSLECFPQTIEEGGMSFWHRILMQTGDLPAI